MKLLTVRRGRSPNCSSAGMLVGAALVSAVVGAAVFNAFADRLARRKGDDGERVRREDFGAIVASEGPPALLFVDDMPSGKVIGGRASPTGALSAPTEVHMAVTERCPVTCTGCYLSAGPDGQAPEPTFEMLRADLDRLAGMGVFEVAFGGGEAVLREDILKLARYARALGMVPNLTTSGFGITAKRAVEMAEVFGQVNVSLDGLGESYVDVRGWDGERVAVGALRRLKQAGLRVGVNTVLSRKTLAHLPELAGFLAKEGISDWQWLRFKPTGRGVDVYDSLALTPEQATTLFPLALAVEADHGVSVRFDCALAPFLVEHLEDLDRATQLGVIGCVGGESLLARGSDGRWSACSFSTDRVDGDVESVWDEGSALVAWRERAERPPEPCASCTWRSVCRGGCRVVAAHLTGDPLAADPECPRVRAL